MSERTERHLVLLVFFIPQQFWIKSSLIQWFQCAKAVPTPFTNIQISVILCSTFFHKKSMNVTLPPWPPLLIYTLRCCFREWFAWIFWRITGAQLWPSPRFYSPCALYWQTAIRVSCTKVILTRDFQIPISQPSIMIQGQIRHRCKAQRLLFKMSLRSF